MKWGTMTAAAAVVAFGAAAPASALIVIDDFQVNQRVTDVPTTGLTNSSEVAAPVLGGHRELRVNNFNATLGGTDLRAEDGLLKFSNNAGTTGEGFSIYDGAGSGAGATGLGGVSFLIGPNPFFDFDVVATDIAGLEFQVNVLDTSGRTANYTEFLPSVQDLETRLFLTQFTTETDFDFGAVDSLAFYVRSDVDSLDGILDRITLQAVPVPAAAFLLVGAIGGLGALRLRRKS